MNTLPNFSEVEVKDLQFDYTNMIVNLTDGSTISFPLHRYPRLQNATVEELNDWQIIGHGYGIAWDKIDEHISINGILAGRKSGESQASFEKWLAGRK